MQLRDNKEWDNLTEWFRNTFRPRFEDVKDCQDWKTLEAAAIYYKHTGDLDRAIEAMVKAIELARCEPSLSAQTASMLNYLAGELYWSKGAYDQAEATIQDALGFSQHCRGENLFILASIQLAKGQYREALASAEQSREAHYKQENPHGITQAEALIESIKATIQDRITCPKLLRETQGGPPDLGSA